MTKKNFLVPMKLPQALLMLGACDARLSLRDCTIEQAFKKATMYQLRWIYHATNKCNSFHDAPCFLCKQQESKTKLAEIKASLSVLTLARALRAEMLRQGADLVDPIFTKKVK